MNPGVGELYLNAWTLAGESQTETLLQVCDLWSLSKLLSCSNWNIIMKTKMPVSQYQWYNGKLKKEIIKNLKF